MAVAAQRRGRAGRIPRLRGAFEYGGQPDRYAASYPAGAAVAQSVLKAYGQPHGKACSKARSQTRPGDIPTQPMRGTRRGAPGSGECDAQPGCGSRRQRGRQSSD